MKTILLTMLLALVFPAVARCEAPAMSQIPFSTMRAEFEPGDRIVIKEVLASSPELALGDTVVIRGEYQLSSRESAGLRVSLTTIGKGSPERLSARAGTIATQGSDKFELECKITRPGVMHVSFYPLPTGGSFGGVYIAPNKS